MIRSLLFCLSRSHTEHLGAGVQQQVEEVSSAEAALLHGLCKLQFSPQLWIKNDQSIKKRSNLVPCCAHWFCLQAYCYHGQTLLASDKCGEAIRSLQEAEKCMYVCTVLIKFIRPPVMKTNILEIRLQSCLKIKLLLSLLNHYYKCELQPLHSRYDTCRLQFLLKVTMFHVVEA